MAEPVTHGLKLFNSLTGRLEDFMPLDPQGKKVKMYVCGPTVYDDAHLGHARCYITWDVLYRFLQFVGYDVTYVRNVTDVDDKILARAKEQGETPGQLAARNYQSFQADMRALNVADPTHEPRATDYIPQMLEGIQALIANGSAYATPDGSVYFRVSAKADYGKLKFGTQDLTALKKHLDDLKAGARVEVDEIKESPLDFALWKAAPLNDPNGWESPWPAAGGTKGWGRPGWHMECSAMNHALFGAQIDIHAGGADLIFPHHENEIAQSEAWSHLSGRDDQSRFAKYWLHNGFVNVSGTKMSKSLGNFSTIKKVLERYDANTIRYFLLTNHYRMPVDFDDEALNASANWVKKKSRDLKSAQKKLAFSFAEVQDLVIHQAHNRGVLNTAGTEASEFVKFRNDLLGEDLNTAKALATLNTVLTGMKGELSNSDVTSATPGARDLKSSLVVAISILNVLGFNLELLFGEDLEAFSELESDALAEMIGFRKAAKTEKNWAEADRIRNQINEMGLQIRDNKDGTTTVEKDGLEILRV